MYSFEIFNYTTLCCPYAYGEIETWFPDSSHVIYYEKKHPILQLIRSFETDNTILCV